MESNRKTLEHNSQNPQRTFTNAEQKLWQQLQHKQLLGVQFNYQKPVSIYIVGFYCETAKLVIEINGTQHFDTAYLLNSSIRDQTLRNHGLHVLRFNNRQVLMNMEAVIKVIHGAVSERVNN